MRFTRENHMGQVLYKVNKWIFFLNSLERTVRSTTDEGMITIVYLSCMEVARLIFLVGKRFQSCTLYSIKCTVFDKMKRENIREYLSKFH